MKTPMDITDRNSLVRLRLRTLPVLTALYLCVVFAAGCAHRQDDERGRHAARYSDVLAARTAGVLSTSSELTLDGCVAIALENNLALKSKQIQSRLAALDRQAAFSAFLPTVELEFNSSDNNHQQAVWTGSGYVPMSDKAVTRLTVSALQPVFLPRAWFLYSMRKSNEDISLLVEERTRQLITLRVTVAYFACLSYGRATPALEASVGQARALLDELVALDREGLVMRSDRDKAEALLAARGAELTVNRRIVVAAKASLLETMGLAPLANITLDPATQVPPDARELPEQVLAAMRNRGELHVADKAIEVSDAGVRAAIADFLPSLFLLGSYNSSSDGYLKYSDIWTGGVSGVLTLFDGFGNVARYKAARVSREEAFARREEACLAVMMEVLYARLRADIAAESMVVADAGLRAANSALDEVEALAREGLATQSARLDALAQRDMALAQVAMARYQQQVAFATLSDVIGRPREEKRK